MAESRFQGRGVGGWDLSCEPSAAKLLAVREFISESREAD